jgi:hypothetical protein
MVERITLSGQVRDYDLQPIRWITVDVYRETPGMQSQMVAHGLTDGEGKYEVTLLPGTPITVRFDTSPTVANARRWHPSVVVNIDAQHDLVLDRFLLRVGFGGTETAAIDALTAYQFCAMWNDGDQLYAESARDRISGMKLSTSILEEVQQKLAAHFRTQALLL